MTVFKPTITLFCAVLLAGCASPEGGTSRTKQNIVDVTFNQSAAGFTPAGYTMSKVNIVQLRPSGVTLNAVDDVAADCTLTGNRFSAEFQTPATVKVPNYGGSSLPITLDCTYNSKKITRKLGAVNISQNQRNAKTSNAVTGVIFLNPGLIAAGAASKVEVGPNGEDLFGYPDFRIEIN